MSTNSEASPLINSSRKNPSKCKCAAITLIVLVIGSVIASIYSFSNNVQHDGVTNKLFVEDNPDTEMFPMPDNSDSAVWDAYDLEQDIVIIKYDMNDYDVFSPASDIASLTFDSGEWKAFHEYLVRKKGYNIKDSRYQFLFQIDDVDVYEPPRVIVKQQDLETEEDDNGLSAQWTAAKTPKPTKGPKPTKAPKIRPSKDPKIKPSKAPKLSKAPKIRPTKAPKPTSPPTPIISNLQCFTRYTFGTGRTEAWTAGGFYEVDCLDENGIDYELVGCISYTPNVNPALHGYTSGERILHKSNYKGTKDWRQCFSWQASRYTQQGIGARCCMSTLKRDKLYLNHGVTLAKKTGVDHSERTALCDSKSECTQPNGWAGGQDWGVNGPEEGTVTVACNAYYGKTADSCVSYSSQNGCGAHNAWSDKPYGSKFDLTSQTCEGARGDGRYLQLTRGCLGSTKYSIDCQWVESDAATFHTESGKYRSEIRCPAPYKIADCNSFVHNAIETCSMDSSTGIIYGGFFSHDPTVDSCIAVGSSSYVRAQASCCRVYEGNSNEVRMDKEEMYFNVSNLSIVNGIYNGWFILGMIGCVILVVICGYRGYKNKLLKQIQGANDESAYFETIYMSSD